MDRPVLKNEDASRAIGDEVVRKLHDELLKLGLVQFDSGYASIRQGNGFIVCRQSQNISYFSVSVLLTEENGIYLAQCIEYDIAAQGSSIEKAKRAFEKTIVGQIILDIQYGKKPLEGIPETLLKAVGRVIECRYIQYPIRGFEKNIKINYLTQNSTLHVEGNDFIIMPSSIKAYNGSSERCDMFVGPCSCGAWHHKDDWGQEIQRIVTEGLKT